MKILVVNGPNLNMLGVREPDVYGRKSYADLARFIVESAAALGVEVELYQSNHEGRPRRQNPVGAGRVRRHRHKSRSLHAYVGGDPGRAEGGGPARGGSAPERRFQARGVPASLLRRHGVRKVVHRAGL